MPLHSRAGPNWQHPTPPLNLGTLLGERRPTQCRTAHGTGGELLVDGGRRRQHDGVVYTHGVATGTSTWPAGCSPEALPDVSHVARALAVVVARRAGRRPGRLAALAALPRSTHTRPGCGRPRRPGA